MRIKKLLRFLMLLIFIILASIIPFPIKFSKKDHIPNFKIEQIDKKEEDDDNESQYQAFS